MSSLKLLDLHISQAGILLDKFQDNYYSDSNKQLYHANLNLLFDSIVASTTPSLDDAAVYNKQEQLNFIFTSLEFLKDSTLNAIPFEVVSCLNLAMYDWVDKDEYIIVTSLNNNINSFSYDPTLALQDFLYQSIATDYNITFNKRLVQINLPLILSKDYFSSVVLYHELGHFIDLKYGISEKIALHIALLPQLEKNKLVLYIPYINQINVHNYQVLTPHIAEYFCDVFASQYIGSTSNYYLKYLTKNSNIYGNYHPATTNRITLVDNFISKNQDVLLDIIQIFTRDSSKRLLQKRYDEISSEDFYKFIPAEISSASELHGVFNYGWNVYLNDWDAFKTLSHVENLTGNQAYKIINNLIEKSIGNYFINEDWKKSITLHGSITN